MYKYEKASQLYPEDFDEGDDTTYAVCKYQSSVSVVKKRLNILGFSLSECEKELKKGIDYELTRYEEYLADHKEGDTLFDVYSGYKEVLSVASIKSFVTAYKTIFEHSDDILNIKAEFGEYKGLHSYISDSVNEYALGIPVEDLRFSFRILLECFDVDDLVELDVSDLVASGWYEYTEDLVELSRQQLTENYHYDSKIIILTEGSSDKHILEKSLAILYPEFQSYYTFMDFGISKASGGASSLVSVIKAFLGTGIQNRIIALFDNDTAARVAMKGLANIRLPDNMRVMTYPRYDFLESFPTIGPSGKHNLDVNQLAGSIELYLCHQALVFDNEISSVQWKGFDQSLSCYQGEVLNKSKIQEQFYSIVGAVSNKPDLKEQYNWDGLELIFKYIFEAFENTAV